MKTKIIYSTVFLILFSANVLAQKQDAAAAVRAFYKFHQTRADVFEARELKAYQKFFTSRLNRLFQIELRRENEYLKTYPTNKPHFGDGFPFQPFDECTTSADGKPIKNAYDIGAPIVRNERATVAVKFYQPQECGGALIDVYKVELANSKGKWLIDDWLYSDAKTLTEDLQRAEY